MQSSNAHLVLLLTMLPQLRVSLVHVATPLTLEWLKLKVDIFDVLLQVPLSAKAFVTSVTYKLTRIVVFW